jgi:uncharacterized protein
MSAVPETLVVAGETVELWPQRGIGWPVASTVLIADLHLGKGDAFRRAGLALPSGGTAGDLARLGELVARTGARRLVVLGDMLHGAVRDAPWVAQWHAWRAAQAGLRIDVVAGNHDRALRQAALGIEVHEDGLRHGPFVFRHLPRAEPGAYAWAGHLHPVVALPGLRGRLPAFAVGPEVGVLPAFSAFTGGVYLARDSTVRLYACAGDGIVALPTRPPLRGRP